MKTLAISTLTVLAWLARVSAAQAQGTDQRAAAEVLFNEARKLMDAGNYAEACSRLEQSEQIEPAAGTLGWLAQCYEKSGKTATAWATYRQAASFAEQRGQSARQRLALEQAAKLEPGLSRLTVDAAALDGVEGAEILRNGKPVVRALWSSAVPVDPGDQHLEIRAPGYAPATLNVLVPGSGGKTTVKIPQLVRASAAFVAAPTPIASIANQSEAPITSAAVAAPAPVAPAKDASSWSSRGRGPIPPQAIAGYFAGGVGVIGLGVGLAFFFEKNSKITARDAACPAVESGGDCPSETKQQEYGSRQDEAGTASTVSLVSTLAGGALLTTGIVLLVTAPSRDQAANRMKFAPVALRGGAGFWMETTW